MIVRIWFYHFSNVAHYLTKNLIPSDHGSHGIAKCIMNEKLSWKNRTPLKSFIHSFIQKSGPRESTLSILTTTCLVLGPLDPLPLSLTKIFSLSFYPFSSSLSIEEQSRHAKLNSLKRSKHQRKTTSKFPSQIFLLNPHGCKLFFDLWKTNKKKILFSPPFIAFGWLLFCFLLELVGLCSSLCVFNKLVYFQLNGFNSTPHMIIWRLMSSDVIGCCLFLPCNLFASIWCLLVECLDFCCFLFWYMNANIGSSANRVL